MDKQVDEEARLKTQSSATVDASALFRRGTGADPIKLWTRLKKVGVAMDDFRHTFSVSTQSTSAAAYSMTSAETDQQYDFRVSRKPFHKWIWPRVHGVYWDCAPPVFAEVHR
jgi:hypothetical protein